MSTDKKVKVYRNPARNRPETHKPYVPQYQLLGRDPEEYNSPLAPGYQPPAPTKGPASLNNPRLPRPVVQQPYAEAVSSPVGRGRGLLPNVGNNMEQTWSSVDGEVVDDISGPVNSQQQMVDNNEFVSAASMGLPEETVLEEPVEESRSFLTQNELQTALSEDYLSGVIKELGEDEHLLLVNGEAVCSGPVEMVQEQARLLIFGEHPEYGGNPVSVDDIIVIKRTKIKVGVFLE